MPTGMPFQPQGFHQSAYFLHVLGVGSLRFQASQARALDRTANVGACISLHPSDVRSAGSRSLIKAKDWLMVSNIEKFYLPGIKSSS
jgi:hypothetical protein